MEGLDEVTGREQTVQTCYEAEMTEMGCPEYGLTSPTGTAALSRRVATSFTVARS